MRVGPGAEIGDPAQPALAPGRDLELQSVSGGDLSAGTEDLPREAMAEAEDEAEDDAYDAEMVAFLVRMSQLGMAMTGNLGETVVTVPFWQSVLVSVPFPLAHVAAGCWLLREADPAASCDGLPLIEAAVRTIVAVRGLQLLYHLWYAGRLARGLRANGEGGHWLPRRLMRVRAFWDLAKLGLLVVSFCAVVTGGDCRGDTHMYVFLFVCALWLPAEKVLGRGFLGVLFAVSPGCGRLFLRYLLASMSRMQLEVLRPPDDSDDSDRTVDLASSGRSSGGGSEAGLGDLASSGRSSGGGSEAGLGDPEDPAAEG